MGHAEHDLLEAKRAAALQDLLQRRDQRFAAIETETLGALVLHVEELLEAFGLDQLLQNGLLAFGGEGDFLVGALDALLDPRLLLGIGDMHELDAERRTIGAGEDFQHLPDGAEFEAQNIVEEDRPVVVGFGEAVILRRQLVVVLERVGDAERIEIGVQMAAHAEGADHHDGAHGIARLLMDIGLGDGDAVGDGLFLDLLLDRLFDQAPIAVERRNQFAIGGQRPGRPRPGCALGVPAHIGRIVLQRGEEFLPLRIDRGGIVLIGGIKRVDIVGVAAIKERGEGKLVVGLILSCHLLSRSVGSVS